jgi:hypothetical protein
MAGAQPVDDGCGNRIKAQPLTVPFNIKALEIIQGFFIGWRSPSGADNAIHLIGRQELGELLA